MRRWLACGIAVVAVGSGAIAPAPAAAAVVAPNPAIYLANAATGSAEVFTGSGASAGSAGVGFGSGDGFAVGDVTGDGVDELVVADREAGRIRVLDAAGAPVAEFPVGLQFGFDLAVGDTNADGRDDIVVRRTDFLPFFSSVDVFDATGTPLGGVNGLLMTKFVGVGDADGDGAGDIWVHDGPLERMLIHSLTGTQVGAFPLADVDGLAVGDLTGDQVSEVVVGSAAIGLIRILNRTGTLIKAFPGFVAGASLSIGDVDGNDTNDIAVARPTVGAPSGVTGFNTSGQRILRFDAPFTARDGFAVRSRPVDRGVLLGPQKPGFHQVVLGVAADDSNVYATHFYQSQADPHVSDGPGALVVLDRVTLTLKARIPVGFGPRAVAVNPVTHKVYVLNGFAPGVPSAMAISVIDRDALAVVNTITLLSGQPSVDIAVNANLNRIYVSNTPAGRIQVIDGATNQELAPILIGPGPVGMAVDETTNTLHVALNNRVTQPFVTALGSVIDHGGSHTILPPVTLGPTGTQPVDVAVDPVNNRIFTANLGGGNIHPSATVLDATTRAIITQLPLTRPGRAVAVNPLADQVFVAGEENVYVIGARSLSVLRTIPADLPFAIAAPVGADRHVYTGDLRSGVLNRYAYAAGE